MYLSELLAYEELQRQQQEKIDEEERELDEIAERAARGHLFHERHTLQSELATSKPMGFVIPRRVGVYEA